MGAFAKGSVILIPFPFSDLSQAKMRPAVVLAGVENQDYILCQVTSKPYADRMAVKIEENDFEKGSLRLVSYARPTKLFTANEDLFFSCVGKLSEAKSHEIVETIVQILTKSF